MTALASVVVFCTTYVLILPAITLTVDEGWMNQLTETHVYINCPGEALYETNNYVGTVSEDFGSADSGSGDSVDVGADDVPMSAAPEGFFPDEETGQTAQSDPSPPGGESGQETRPSPGTGTVTRPDSGPKIPEQPEDPAEGSGPEQPEDSTGTDSPKQPEDSTGTDSPEQPENPIEPETPVDPEQTTKPDDSTDPEQNNEPETPENPDTITDPENPTDPEDTDPEPAEPDGETDVGENEISKGDNPGGEPEALPEEPEVPHEHTESCYDEEGNLICEQEKAPEAPLEEPEVPHEHTDECYDEEGNLVCGLETEEPRIEYSHIHTEDCFEMTEDGESVLICEEEGHVHDADCLDDNGELVICGYEGYFPEDAKLVWVEINKTFTFGLTRYTVTGRLKLPKGMTQDDLFFELIESAAMFASLDDSEPAGFQPMPVLYYSTEDGLSDNLLDMFNLELTSSVIVSGELPHTGGVGLAAWYAAGGALVAAAGLVRKKAEEEI